MVFPCVPGDGDRAMARRRARRAPAAGATRGSPPRAPRPPRGCARAIALETITTSGVAERVGVVADPDRDAAGAAARPTGGESFRSEPVTARPRDDQHACEVAHPGAADPDQMRRRATPSSEGTGKVGIDPAGGVHSGRAAHRATRVDERGDPRPPRPVAPTPAHRLGHRAPPVLVVHERKDGSGERSSAARSASVDRTAAPASTSSRAFASWWCSVANGYGTRIDGHAAGGQLGDARPRHARRRGRRPRARVHPLDERDARDHAARRPGRPRRRPPSRCAGPVLTSSWRSPRSRSGAARRRAPGPGAAPPGSRRSPGPSPVRRQSKTAIAPRPAARGPVAGHRCDRRADRVARALDADPSRQTDRRPRRTPWPPPRPIGPHPVDDPGHAVRLDQHERAPDGDAPRGPPARSRSRRCSRRRRARARGGAPATPRRSIIAERADRARRTAASAPRSTRTPVNG